MKVQGNKKCTFCPMEAQKNYKLCLACWKNLRNDRDALERLGIKYYEPDKSRHSKSNEKELKKRR